MRSAWRIGVVSLVAAVGAVGELISADAGPANRGRLYRNNGDGAFTDVADAAGVRNDRLAKGAAWGDYDGDGRADLYVSNANANAPNRLYRNNGDGTFSDLAHGLGVEGPDESFSCGFWDYDNDGRLDLFVAGYNGFVTDVIASAEGQSASPAAVCRKHGPHPVKSRAPRMRLDSPQMRLYVFMNQ